MFTGIIQAVGEVAALEQSGGDLKLRIKTGKLPLADVQLGDSIATNGVSLTVTELPGDGYWADVSNETLSLTSLKQISIGSPVNLEKSLTPTTALGGHLVSGHVDGLGTVVALSRDARSWRVSIEAPADLARYIAPKGSICVDGTSLTVNSVSGARLSSILFLRRGKKPFSASMRWARRSISRWISSRVIWSDCSSRVLFRHQRVSPWIH